MNAMWKGIGGLTALLMLGSAALAGDLNPPPGPVSPTDDVVLNAQAITLPYVINQPGAYRLTSNFVGSPLDGIQVMSDDVWLDLGGFVLDGAGAIGDGIVMMGPFSNCTILNGAVINWGDDGIDLSQGTGNRIINVSVRNNAAEGIECFETEVLDCLATGNGFDGILAFQKSLVVRCRTDRNQGTGIFVDMNSKVENCTSQFNQSDGIHAIFGCLIIECTASDNQGVGIIAGEHSKIGNCTSMRNTDGIVGWIGGLIVDCQASENLNIGIFTDVGGTVMHCHSSRNVDGFHGLLGAKIVECSASENSQYGYLVDSGATVRECNASFNFVTGIYVNTLCEIANNHLWQNGGGEAGPGIAGIECAGSGNRISDNDAKDNPQNYFDPFGGNTYFGNSSHQPAGIGLHYNVFFLPNDVAPIGPAAAGPTRYANTIY